MGQKDRAEWLLYLSDREYLEYKSIIRSSPLSFLSVCPRHLGTFHRRLFVGDLGRALLIPLDLYRIAVVHKQSELPTLKKFSYIRSAHF